MKLHRLWIDCFKNLRNCEVTFEQPYLLNAVIGGNGSGKSNLVEAILHILVGVYLNKPLRLTSASIMKPKVGTSNSPPPKVA